MKRAVMSAGAVAIGLAGLLGTAGSAVAAPPEGVGYELFFDKRPMEQRCHDKGGTYTSTGSFSSCKYGSVAPAVVDSEDEGLIGELTSKLV